MSKKDNTLETKSLTFFNVPEEKAVVRPLLEKRAKELNLVINSYMEHKIKWSEDHGGRCMCDWEHRKCPCDNISKDLVKYDGECLCKVLVTNEKMKKIKKEQRTKNKKKTKKSKEKPTEEKIKKDKIKIEEAKVLAKKLGCKNC